jgi:hypothetical protein
VLEQETGSVTTADLEHMMGLVVHDHDDPFTLISDHRSPAQRALIEDLIIEDRANGARRVRADSPFPRVTERGRERRNVLPLLPGEASCPGARSLER